MAVIDNGTLQNVTEEDIQLLKEKPRKFWEKVRVIGDKAFKDCTSLTSISIPEGVTKIEWMAFQGCTSLTSIVIPEGVTEIGGSAFEGCTSLTSIAIPEGVTKIEWTAFKGCTSLTSISIPKSIKQIDMKTLTELIDLKEGIITIPEGVDILKNDYFYGISNVNIYNKRVHGDLLVVDELLESIKNNNNIYLKPLNKLYSLAKEQGITEDNIREFVKFAASLGILEPEDTKIQTGKNKKGEPVMTSVSDIAYTFIQGLIKKQQIDLNNLHMYLHAMKFGPYNEEFMKFVVKKDNWLVIKEDMELLPRIYDWFEVRKNLDLTQDNDVLLPTEEKNRYRVLVSSIADTGIDRQHWQVPTVENLKKEFVEVTFTGVVTKRDGEIGDELLKYPKIYQQRHFDKAKEIDEERKRKGVTDILTTLPKEDKIKSLDEYQKKTQEYREQIISDSAEILHEQIEDTSSVFTYEVLEKSDVANFAMGIMTSCCATLYGAGAGAMRGMIIHPDMQPLVIRDFNNKIIAFGIIYVNREEGYAVVNDFEVNKKYEDKKGSKREEQRRAIYNKAMEGVVAFVEEYNKEYPEIPIMKVTCGISPNWDAINGFIRKNPQSSILKAPDFSEFHYAGSSGRWPGDWHKEQYVIYNAEDGGINV